MINIFRKGNDTTLLLLHGTGGNEYDLLHIANLIDRDASILSIRGNVIENGHYRFFKRLSDGVFDLEDLKLRTKELNAFLDESSLNYGFNRQKIVAIGYSNGANIASSLLFHYQDSLNGAILLHPIIPLRNMELPKMQNVKVFIGAGINDEIAPPKLTKELASVFEKQGANVTLSWHLQGHRLTTDELNKAKKWYDKYYL